MKKICRFAITVAILFNIGMINAQNKGDHLEPVRGIFNVFDYQSEYYSRVRKVLFSGLSDLPEIRFQVMPSFTPENVLDIEFDRESGKYYIIYHICDQMIWNNGRWQEVEVSRFKAEIDKEAVKLIKSLFSKAIAQVKFPPIVEEGAEITIGTDGVNYYFTVNEYGYGIKSGTVWSPNNGTKMNRLVSTGNKLIELAKSNTRTVKFNDQLQKEVEELIDELE